MAARMRIETVLILIIAATFCAGAVAQSSSCNNVLISMSPCLDYITGNSSTPSSSCCSQLSNVIRSQPRCLCEVFSGGGSSSLGININQTQAMALPNACNVQTPPASRCNGSGSSPSGTPESPSGNGSKTAPSPDVNSSNGNATKLTFSLLVFLLFLQASYTSIFTI